jgi:hypothetical protein
MKTYILLIFIILLINNLLKGQETTLASNNHKIYSGSLQIGLNQIKEMNLLPLVHKGILTELSFETEKINNTLRQFQCSFIYSRVKTNLEEMSKSGNIKIGFNYSYNFPIIQNSNLRYYLGPQTSLSYSFMLFPNWDDSHAYWADYFSFGPNNVLSVTLRNKTEWFTSFNFALFSLFSRPEEIRPFKMDDSSAGGILQALNSNIEPGFVNKALQINLKTEYRFPVFVTKQEAITYNMDIIRLSREGEHPVLQIIYRIGIKIML